MSQEFDKFYAEYQFA